MLKLPAHTNLYGTFDRYETFVEKRWNAWPWGYNPTFTTHNALRETARREGYSKNPIRRLDGTSTLWRDPSSYERSVWKLISEEPQLWSWVAAPDNTAFIERKLHADAHVRFYIDGKLDGRHRVEWSTNSAARAKTECLLKIGDGKAQLGAALAEATKTADMVGGLATSLFKSLLAAKRGQWSRIPKEFGISQKSLITGKTSAGRLLEIKYGWLPLMSDIKGLHDVLTSQLAPALLITKRRNVFDSGFLTEADTSPSWKNHVPGLKFRGMFRRQHTCVLTGQLNDHYLYKAQQSGIVNPLSLAWELVPYSFVIDWAVPIGNVLEALTATAGLKFIGGYEGVSGDFHCQVEEHPTGSYKGKPNKGTFATVSHRRNKFSAWPLPEVYTKSPFSTSNVVTALGLFRQLFR